LWIAEVVLPWPSGSLGVREHGLAGVEMDLQQLDDKLGEGDVLQEGITLRPGVQVTGDED